jgi:hypothetical protein
LPAAQLKRYDYRIMSNNFPEFIFVFGMFVFLIFLFVWLDHIRSLRIGTKILQDWAKENEYDLINLQLPILKFSPFFLNSSRRQRIFLVRIKTSNGNQREAWIRLGDFFSGLRIPSVKIEWVK